MVTRNRQRESENEAVWRVWECSICNHRIALLQSYGRYEGPRYCPACNNSILYFNHLEEQPGVIFSPSPQEEPEPAPKRIKKTITDPSPKLTRAQKETKQRDTKPEKGRHWTAHSLSKDDLKNYRYYVEFFNKHLNYQWGNLWAIRHCEIQYEGESDPL